jgi:hypothetical protein
MNSIVSMQLMYVAPLLLLDIIYYLVVAKEDLREDTKVTTVAVYVFRH